MKNEGVCPVIAMLNLCAEESLELLGSIKLIRRVYNGEKIDIKGELNA
jgi:hypothetical protein